MLHRWTALTAMTAFITVAQAATVVLVVEGKSIDLLLDTGATAHPSREGLAAMRTPVVTLTLPSRGCRRTWTTRSTEPWAEMSFRPFA